MLAFPGASLAELALAVLPPRPRNNSFEGPAWMELTYRLLQLTNHHFQGVRAMAHVPSREIPRPACRQQVLPFIAHGDRGASWALCTVADLDVPVHPLLHDAQLLLRSPVFAMCREGRTLEGPA